MLIGGKTQRPPADRFVETWSISRHRHGAASDSFDIFKGTGEPFWRISLRGAGEAPRPSVYLPPS